MRLWTFHEVCTDKFLDTQDLTEAQFFPPTRIYRTWQEAQTAAIMDLEGEIEDLKGESDAEGEIEDYRDAIDGIQALDEPTEPTDYGRLEHRVSLGDDLVIHFYNMNLED